MKFDPNFLLTGLDGKPLVGTQDGIHAGKLLARKIFFNPSESDPQVLRILNTNALKWHSWALKLYDMQPIEIDNDDKQKLIDFIKVSDLFVVASGPLIKMLNELK